MTKKTEHAKWGKGRRRLTLQISYPGADGRKRKNISFDPGSTFRADLAAAKKKFGTGDASEAVRLAVYDVYHDQEGLPGRPPFLHQTRLLGTSFSGVCRDAVRRAAQQ